MDKIQAANPNIIIRGNDDEPYYLIEYYDLSDNEWHIGYGSYCLANVKEWLKTCFEVTNADVTPVKRGFWKPISESEMTGFNPKFAGRDPIAGYKCSNCGTEAIFSCNDEFVLSDYCPNCGARMDKGECDDNKQVF